MNKSELLENYTAEQLADMVVGLQDALRLKVGKCEVSENDDVIKAKCDKCGEEFIALLDNEHILCTKAELFATREANKQLNRDITKLQSEVEKYRKAFEDTKKERDCQISEYQNKIKELEKRLDRSQTTINQIDGILEELFGVKHDAVEYGEFGQFLRDKVTEKVADFLPTEPIKVADMLIDNATEVYENYVEDFAKTYSGQLVIGNPCEDVRRQTLSYLRQIAEHLLVYAMRKEPIQMGEQKLGIKLPNTGGKYCLGIRVFIDRNEINAIGLFPTDKHGRRLKPEEKMDLEYDIRELEVANIEEIALLMNKETFEQFCKLWREYHETE